MKLVCSYIETVSLEDTHLVPKPKQCCAAASEGLAGPL